MHGNSLLRTHSHSYLQSPWETTRLRLPRDSNSVFARVAALTRPLRDVCPRCAVVWRTASELTLKFSSSSVNVTPGAMHCCEYVPPCGRVFAEGKHCHEECK